MLKQSRLRNARGLATWLKVVLIASGLCFLGLVGLCVAGFMFFQGVTSPAKVKEATSAFMNISDPLPAGFKYVFGGIFFDTPMAVIQGDNTRTIYTFFVIPQSKSTKLDTTPEQAIDEIAKGGSAPSAPGAPGAPSASASKKLTVTSHATLDVAGQKMPYVIGHAEQKPGSTTSDVDNTFFGAIKSTISGKMVFVMAQSIDTSAKPEPMTIDKVKQLTDSITKF